MSELTEQARNDCIALMDLASRGTLARFVDALIHEQLIVICGASEERQALAAWRKLRAMRGLMYATDENEPEAIAMILEQAQTQGARALVAAFRMGAKNVDEG